MCKFALVVGPANLSRSERISYISDVNNRINSVGKEEKLYFIFGKGRIRLPRHSTISMIIFNLGRNAPRVICSMVGSVKQRNGGIIPTCLRIDNDNKKVLGCTNVPDFESVILSDKPSVQKRRVS